MSGHDGSAPESQRQSRARSTTLQRCRMSMDPLRGLADGDDVGIGELPSTISIDPNPGGVEGRWFRRWSTRRSAVWVSTRLPGVSRGFPGRASPGSAFRPPGLDGDRRHWLAYDIGHLTKEFHMPHPRRVPVAVPWSLSALGMTSSRPSADLFERVRTTGRALEVCLESIRTVGLGPARGLFRSARRVGTTGRAVAPSKESKVAAPGTLGQVVELKKRK